MEAAMDMSILFLACCVAVGFITATSLILASNVGKTLHVRQNGAYKYRGRDVEKQRRIVRGYPTIVFAMYVVIAILLFLTTSASSSGIEKPSPIDAHRVMVVFSSTHIAYILWEMRRFCLVLFDIMKDNEHDGRES